MEQDDVITNIPKTMEKFFGCSGKMLRPCPATVEDLIKKIPKDKLSTTELIRKKLAAEFEVQATCPATTDKALQTIANSAAKTAYWRVLKKKGELIAKFPGGVEGHAKLLRKEGFTIEKNGKVPSVKDFTNKLHQFK